MFFSGKEMYGIYMNTVQINLCFKTLTYKLPQKDMLGNYRAPLTKTLMCFWCCLYVLSKQIRSISIREMFQT